MDDKTKSHFEKNYPASSGPEAQGSLAKALYEKGGAETLPLIASIFRRLGAVQGVKMRKKLGCEDFKSAAWGLFGPALKAQPPRAEFIELTDNKLVIKAFTCRLGLFGAGRNLCEAIMEIDRAMVSGMVGKDVDMKIEKTLAADDDCCLIEIRIV
ncbi:MAG: L-2-amino-thiazoline-4-carboxylic acid hydrolase [Deltaproteobacteria bacterium]|nr:L-2-amino-thiazoline-4-carboxylic acid hydrolase [Deltaproteobacteria bacterium]